MEANQGALTYEETLAVAEGLDLDAYRREVALHDEIRAEAERYENLPPEQWPSNLQINWDFSPQSQRFALDGVSAAEFEQTYSSAFSLGWSALADFDAKLCHFSRRDTVEELWQCGLARK